jgi:murein DD-endopeptidase MepM/ murein hydrolase activator NlpD
MSARQFRRWRATRKLLAIDTPFVWRIGAHGVVLAVSLGLFVWYQLPAFGAAGDLSQGDSELAHLAWRVRERSSLQPMPVLGTTHGAGQETGRGGAPTGPGFVSPGPIAEADTSLLPWDEPQVYIAQAGDTVTGIAALYGVEPETLLFANPSMRENPHSLSIGDTITILPVDGVLHVVAEGDTLESIAEEYEADVDDIIGYTPNGVTPDTELVAGTEVVVPGGEMEIEIPSYVAFVTGPVGRSAVWASDGGNGPIAGTGSFHIAAFGRISQWYTRWHRGIDIANHTGTPIYAVDSGSVDVAGWYGWAGNAVILDHGNGYESLYAHMNTINVSPGQPIQRGQIIGTIGCSRGYGGRCTGPHLHIEVYYKGSYTDPCSLGVCP